MPVTIILPILDLKLNSVCAQLVSTVYSQPVQVCMNIILATMIIDLKILAVCHRSYLSRRRGRQEPVEIQVGNRLAWLDALENPPDEIQFDWTTKKVKIEDDHGDGDTVMVHDAQNPESTVLARKTDLFLPFTYNVIDPIELYKGTAHVAWAAMFDVLAFARHVGCTDGLEGWREPHGEGCEYCAAWLWACLRAVAKFIVSQAVSLIAIFLAALLLQAPVTPVVAPILILVYWIFLLFHSFELPIFFLNLSGLTWLKYPQLELAFNFSMFYLLSNLHNLIDLLAGSSTSVAKIVQTVDKAWQKGANKLQEKMANVRNSLRQGSAAPSQPSPTTLGCA